jgi:hypothetical protein
MSESYVMYHADLVVTSYKHHDQLVLCDFVLLGPCHTNTNNVSILSGIYPILNNMKQVEAHIYALGWLWANHM